MKKIIITVAGLLTCLCASADWSYLQVVDDMTSQSVDTARIDSKNSLALAPPYQGLNHGSLMVVKDKKIGFGMMLSIEKGQVICDSYHGCSVAFRFDDAQPIKFHAIRTADYSSTNLVFRDGRRFVAAAAKAKRILVQITMYQAGEKVLEFQTANPLQWADARPPASARPKTASPKKADNPAPAVVWPSVPASLNPPQ